MKLLGGPLGRRILRSPAVECRKQAARVRLLRPTLLIRAPSFDHQAPYIDFWLRMIGVHEVRRVVVDNAWNQDDAQSAASLAAGKQSVEPIVKDFW
jgi:hypothetical protein